MNHMLPLHSVVARILQSARALEKKGDLVFREFGLTTQYFHILFLIANSPAPMLASALADQLVTTRSNVTGIVARMEKKGLIRREHLPDDRRAAALLLNPKGKQAYRAAEEAYHRHLETLAAEFSAKSLETTQASLVKFIRLAN
jgi:MarR family transcriptional regulator, 2-MHQ and catechol-resistance regulon repressor